jgi:hypothetical protein
LKAPLSAGLEKPSHSSLLPGNDRLPGEKSSSAHADRAVPVDPRRILPAPPSTDVFEETNLRVQHILTAEAPGGHLDRIDIDVPVLYQSRSLRWSTEEVAEARELLARLMDYQEKSRQLRSEGVALLDSWNHLIGNSIPAAQLRADSPSLPENEQDYTLTPSQPGLTTSEAIQIKSSGK